MWTFFRNFRYRRSHLQQKVAKSIIPERSCFHFCGEQTRTALMACCSNAKSWWNAEFWLDDRLRPCKHISLELPSPICIVGLSTRVGGQPNCDSTCFSGCEFFLQLDFIIAMIHIFTCQICILGSVVRVVRFISERLPVLVQTVCFQLESWPVVRNHGFWYIPVCTGLYRVHTGR